MTERLTIKPITQLKEYVVDTRPTWQVRIPEVLKKHIKKEGKQKR